MITEIDFEVLQQLRGKGLFADLTLVVPAANNAEFKTHKIIMAASSKYFEEVLTKNPAVDRLVMPNPIIPVFSRSGNIHNAYQAVLDTVYSNKSIKELVNQGLSADNCFAYYGVAASLGLSIMQNIIIEYISGSVLNQGNISSILTDSTKMQIPNLIDKCTFHLLQDFGVALNSKEQSQQLLNLPYDDFLNIISRDDMQVDSEDSIFDLVIKYIDMRDKAPPVDAPPAETFNTHDPRQSAKDEAQPTEGTAVDNPPEEGEAAEAEPKPENSEATPDPPTETPAAEGEPPALAPDVSSLMPDLAKVAEDLMKIVPLTDEQKKKLLLALRYKYISHEKIMKESKNPLLESFKDILMEGLSAKLKNFEPSSLAFQINNNPRQNYSVDPSISRGIEGAMQHQARKGVASMGGATQKMVQNALTSQSRAATNQQHMNRIGLGQNNVSSALNGGLGNQNLSRNLAESQNYSLPPGFVDTAPLPNPGDHFAASGSFGYGSAYDQDRRFKNDSFGKREAPNYASAGLKPSGYASTNGFGQGFGAIHNQGYNPKISSMDGYNQDAYLHEQENDLVFTYRYDFDENGAMYYLGTRGKTCEYVNPYSIGEVKVYFSSMGKGSYEDFVGRSMVNCRTLNEPNAFMGIDLSEGRFIIPSCYTLRNRDSSHHIMLNWLFEGSVDFKTWYILDKRIHKTDDPSYNKIMEKERQMIERRGATSTWSVDQNYLKVASRSVVMQSRPFYGFRFFRVKQISKNSSGADNLALSGFEIYGIAKGANWRLY